MSEELPEDYPVLKEEVPVDAPVEATEERVSIPIEEPDKLVEGTPDQRTDARGRAEACAKVIASVLEDYDCRIVSQLLDLEQVGKLGNKAIIESVWGILPNPPK